jgi:hypothetical protein
MTPPFDTFCEPELRELLAADSTASPQAKKSNRRHPADISPLYDEDRLKDGLREPEYGGKGTRTPGLNAASVALSQLSYTPTTSDVRL